MDIRDALHIKELIIKDLKGDLSSHEREVFDQWLNLSPENNTLYQKIQSEHFMQELIRDESEEFNQHWKKLSKQTIRHKQKRIHRTWSYAAAILILLAIIPAISLLTSRQDDKSTTDIPVTSSGVRIQLADGTIVPIQKTTKNITTEDLSLTNISDSIILKSLTPIKSSPRWNTIIIPKGVDYIIRLDDGTSVHLNAESSIEIPSRFAPHERRVILHGEAYFNVKHADDCPFIVETSRANIKVLGTQFNVKAYDNDTRILTTLLQGRVEVSNTNQKVILQPGMQAAISNTDSITSYPTNTALCVAWREQRLVFDNQSMNEIIQELSHWYDYHFIIVDPAVHQLRFSMNIERYDHFEAIKQIFESIEKVKFDIEGKTIKISMQ